MGRGSGLDQAGKAMRASAPSRANSSALELPAGFSTIDIAPEGEPDDTLTNELLEIVEERDRRIAEILSPDYKPVPQPSVTHFWLDWIDRDETAVVDLKMAQASRSDTRWTDQELIEVLDTIGPKVVKSLVGRKRLKEIKRLARRERRAASSR